MEPPSPHDALVHLVFSQPQHAEGELRRLLPARIGSRIVWSTLATMPGKHVEDELRGRYTDILYSATMAGQTAVLIYLLFEHQSTHDPLMAFRLLRYMVRIWEEFLRKNPKAEKLPAIVPLVLHHSPEGWTSSTELHALLDLDKEALALLAPHLPSFRFLLDDISKETDEALRSRAMTALGRLVLFCLRHGREPARFVVELARWIGVIKEARAAPGGKDALYPIWKYILVTNNAPDPLGLVKQLRAVVGEEEEREIMTVADWLKEEGRNEGRTSLRRTLLKLLRKRFGAVPDTAATRIEEADLPQLETWVDRVLDAASVDEVLAAV